MSAPEESVCKGCGSSLPENELGDLCPSCLLGKGLALADTLVEDSSGDDDIDQIAMVFPHYRVLGKLGGGAMGMVYRAKQLKLDREVAIKVIAEDIAENPQFLQRFEREAQTLAKLNHSNIVTVYDFGRDLDMCYFVMEHVEGQDLAQLLSQRRLNIDEAMGLVRQICDALDYAHGLGVTHRDIKPANIIVTSTMGLKLVDFGLAKLRGGDQAANDLTDTNSAMGTPRYMAPEQWTESREVDSRADIFSLGVLIYELLTGEPPVGFMTPLSDKIGVDSGWDDLISRCVETAPESRYQSVAELRRDLEALIGPAGGSALSKETTLSGDSMPHVILSFAREDGVTLAPLVTAVQGRYRLLEDPMNAEDDAAPLKAPSAFARAKVLLLVVSDAGRGVVRGAKHRLALADRHQMPVLVVHLDDSPLAQLQFLLGTANAWVDTGGKLDEGVVQEVIQELVEVLPAAALDSELNVLTDSTLATETQAASTGKIVAFMHKRGVEPDSELLTALGEALGKHGVEVYQDRHDAIGMEWFQEVQEKVARVDAVIPILSPKSIDSEMLALEIDKAHQSSQAHGKPKILPVRVNFTGALPTDLARCLDHRPYFLWNGPSDTAALAKSLIKALDESRAKVEGKEHMPTGAVPLDSPFYIERDNDEPFHAAVNRGESIVLVKAGRQMGKTSLLARGLNRARQNKERVVLTDLNAFNESSMKDLETFYKALGGVLADELDLDEYPEDVWRDQRGPNDNFGNYVRRKILKPLDNRLIWALDEADRLFAYDYASEAFGLFRSWHNARALDPDKPWSKLTLVISYATEASLFIRDPNMSPFNVGQLLQMQDFSREEVQALNDRYGLPLQSGEEIDALMNLVGGQPYLIRRCLHAMAVEGETLERILAHGADDEGMFGDHLRRITFLLLNYDGGDRALADSLKMLLRGSMEMPAEHFFRLRSAGILTGESRAESQFRCAIYSEYLKRYLL